MWKDELVNPHMEIIMQQIDLDKLIKDYNDNPTNLQQLLKDNPKHEIKVLDAALNAWYHLDRLFSAGIKLGERLLQNDILPDAIIPAAGGDTNGDGLTQQVV